MSVDVQKHLWDSGGDETDVSQGQAGQEEVHRGVEVGVRADSHDDEQIPKHCDQINGEEQSKEDWLHSGIVRHSQEMKFRGMC